ncbi:acylphosphatase [Paucidesulfovibrio gracilis DSM 16080]|uniref:acylphosphatase n=1 Tax=Paucidesulfovibrio gracilis DSM 16080 TaxID=1121449 RepID=A0A1T4XJD9_9BACT|nr:acylphosphatase [Paucidesulfovibrio gracilis]SKA89225.1 acylphosphatase [Paucidesulfovibrio gracilis DSM 16080]
MTKSFHCVVTGKVKGGNFQSWVMDTATNMGLTGWVRYLSDDKAEILLQGEMAQAMRFKRKMRDEAPLPEVQDIEHEIIEHDKSYDGFEMRG